MQKYLDCQLLAAVEGNNLTAVQQLIAQGASLTATDKKGEYNAIQLASKCGSTDVVEFLVALKDCPINTQSKSSGRTALHLASQYGHFFVVDALINAKCDINLRTKLFGRTALHWAAVSGQYSIVERLLQAGSDVNVPDKSIGSTALHMASQLGHKSTVQALLTGGAKVDIVQGSGRTALHLAAMQGHSEVMELLIKAGADINRPSQRLQTPLHFAASGGHQNAVQVLLDYGCNTQCKNKLNMRPIDLAQNKGHEEIVEIILEGQTKDVDKDEPEHRKVVPREIDLRGPKVRRIYEKACTEGRKKVYRARVMFVGQQGVGKTSLAKCLRGEEFQCDEPSTNGIETDPSACVVDIKEWKSTASADDTSNSALSGNTFNSTVARLVAAALRNDSSAEPISGEEGQKMEEERDQREDLEPEQEYDVCSSEDEGFLETADISSPLHKEPTSSLGIRESPKTEELPDEIAEMIEQLAVEGALDVDEEDLDSEPEITLSFWDFGGQSVFYTTHQVFLTNRAIYILVLDATQPLDSSVSPEMRHGVHEIHTEQTTSKVKDYIHFWLNSIHASVSAPRKPLDSGDISGVSSAQNKSQAASPAVFLVATHKDKLVQDAELSESERADEQERMSKEFLTDVRKYLGEHVQAAHEHVLAEQFVVDNSCKARTGDNDPQLSSLQRQLYNVARQQSWMGEEMPIKWLRLEEKVNKLKDEGVKFMSLKEVEEIARSIMIKDIDDVKVILQFYHDLGDIIYFNEPRLENLVILDPQWLIDVFKSIITVKQYQCQDPRCRQYWDKLDKEGILHIQLVDSVWDALNLNSQRDVLLDIMEKFDLICPCVKYEDDDDDDDDEEEEGREEENAEIVSRSVAEHQDATCINSTEDATSEHVQKYFVPSLLKTEIDTENLFPENTISCQFPLYFHFRNGFLPNGLHHRLVAQCLRIWPQNAQLYKNCSVFMLDESHDFVLRKVDSDITVNVVYSPLENEHRSSMKPSPSWCCSVRWSISKKLKDLIGQWVPGLSFQVCVKCPRSAGNLCRYEYMRVSSEIVKKETLRCKCRQRISTEQVKRWFTDDTAVAAGDELTKTPTSDTEIVGLFQESNRVQFIKDKLSVQDFRQFAMHGSFKHVPFSARWKMAMYLDDTSHRLLADYRVLASELNYSNLEISQFTIAFHQGKHPTIELLKSYESRPNSTVARVVEALIKLDRHDVLKELFEGFHIEYSFEF
ncbi:death-associated protein kinase 1-like isoform X2 [Ptychodera flava]|uniref:death-associated protein kinase 1-like isoform X2 n=1 Tax=Ptychodera flava TaxID=63121 RepID=UPI00396A5120